VAAPAAAAAPAEKPAAAHLIEIKSPMVGTFYAASSPDSDPYASVGAAVTEDSVVCIVEAMKVMNEVKAECSGTVVEVCVKNAQPVEYGQVLFRVEPS
jgi:acetyl-CoA carboxylase biotin carboxyl carrier protein